MKKLLSILAIAGLMAACNTGGEEGDKTDSAKQAIDSAADAKIENIDSARDAKIDKLDSADNHKDTGNNHKDSDHK
jgi:hypothetical protein